MSKHTTDEQETKEPTAKEKRAIHLEVIEQTVVLVTTSLGLIAALAWNEVIKNAVSYIWPKPEGNIIAGLIYAVIITIIMVIAAMYLKRATSLTREAEEKLKRKLRREE